MDISFYKFNQNSHNSKETGAGFTLIELLVVISIIGLLASVVLVALNGARVNARVAKAAADLKQLNTVLSLYLDSSGVYPCFDHNWDETKETAWAAPYTKWTKNPWKTEYHWEHGAAGLTFSISMRDVPLAEAQALDKAIDDNNLATGILRNSGGSDPVRLEYGGMDQSVTLVDCHI